MSSPANWVDATQQQQQEDGLPARMNFDQSEHRKFSLRDCHGRFQERENFYPKQT